MSLTPLVAAAAETPSNELPVHPYVVGIVAFALLAFLMVALLAFGKGREHS